MFLLTFAELYRYLVLENHTTQTLNAFLNNLVCSSHLMGRIWEDFKNKLSGIKWDYQLIRDEIEKERKWVWPYGTRLKKMWTKKMIRGKTLIDERTLERKVENWQRDGIGGKKGNWNLIQTVFFPTREKQRNYINREMINLSFTSDVSVAKLCLNHKNVYIGGHI